MNELQEIAYFLSTALAIGLLFGLERGWKKREAQEGKRIAGVRTFGLIGLLGGITALLSEQLGFITFGLAFIAMTAMFTAVYIGNLKHLNDVGITTLIAALLTFMLGALAAQGEVIIAGAVGVIATLLLAHKSLIHSWISALEGQELRAVLTLLLISLVVLPILPNKGYGPYGVLNPYEIWWMVVLIAAISFVGYFSIKFAGTNKGAIFTGLFGGLVASTAVTLHFSRLTKKHQSMGPMLSTGILIACGTMFPRMLIVASILNPALFIPLLIPALVMALFTYIPALTYAYRQSQQTKIEEVNLNNPLDIKTALFFGALLTLIILLAEFLKTEFGDIGILVLAAASGVADVDAITLSLARMSEQDLSIQIAITGIIIAACANNIIKASMASIIGGRQTGLRVGLPLLVSSAAGLLATWLWVW